MHWCTLKQINKNTEEVCMAHYQIGDVIANSMDPHVTNFCCGSIKEVLEGGYTIHFFDESSFFIAQEDAVPLRDVLGQFVDNDSIIADKRFIKGCRHKLFVGGKITSNQYGQNVRHCIKTPDGKDLCIFSENCIPAIEALQLIEPCPRSQIC